MRRGLEIARLGPEAIGLVEAAATRVVERGMSAADETTREEVLAMLAAIVAFTDVVERAEVEMDVEAATAAAAANVVELPRRRA
jgi:hypothetical protein